MKRYSLQYVESWDSLSYRVTRQPMMVEDPKGNYVLFTDVQKAIDKATQPR